MRRTNPIDTKRVDSQKVNQFFAELAKVVTTGRTKVLVKKNPNTGEVTFHIGRNCVCISTTKGGTL